MEVIGSGRARDRGRLKQQKMTLRFHKCLETLFKSLLLCLFGVMAARAEQPRTAASIPFSDDPNLESTTASSSYVPLDSWVYAAMERLYSMGYLDSAYLGLRPWTRIACARMLAETEQKVAASESPVVPLAPTARTV